MGFLSAPGPLEIMVILAIALIVLGPTRLPDAARSVGKGMREFRESLSGLNEPEEDPYDDPEDDPFDDPEEEDAEDEDLEDDGLGDEEEDDLGEDEPVEEPVAHEGPAADSEPVRDS